MFDLGFSELFLIALVALVVLGPQRLPKAARFAGLWIQRARAQWHSVKSEFESQLADEELKGSLRSTRDELYNVRKQLKERGESIRSEFEHDRDRDQSEDDEQELGSASDPELQAMMEFEDQAASDAPEPGEPDVDDPERREPRPDDPERREPGPPGPIRRDPRPGGPPASAPDQHLEDAMIDRVDPIAPDHPGHDRR